VSLFISFPAGGLNLANGADGLQASSSSEVSCDGEALINNRKNKLIAAYELDVRGGWSGRTFPPPQPASEHFNYQRECIRQLSCLHDVLKFAMSGLG
jgi:hypothetical protein